MMKKEKKRLVYREDNNIYIRNLMQAGSVTAFIRVMYEGTNRGYQEFNIIWNPENNVVYPKPCVSIANIIEYYREQGIEFHFEIDESEYLNSCGFVQPAYCTAEEIEARLSPFDHVFKYDSSAQVAAFTKKCVDYISHQEVCEPGVLDSMTWCINEVMDNVLVHSQSKYGYVMAQYHVASKHIAICVADQGVGIWNSLKTGKHHPRKEVDALTLAIQEGVGDGNGQGNGLYGLSQIVKANKGILTLRSGSGLIMLKNNESMRKSDELLYVDPIRKGTYVDFQLDLKKNVDIKATLSSIGGFDGFDIRIDDMLQDDDSLLYDIFQNCEGTATRDAGRKLRNDIINTIKRTHQRITLDFTDIETVSSSFIDELIAKMMIELGIVTFNQIVTIKGLKDTIKYLCERSIYMRIYEEWSKKVGEKAKGN